MNVLAFAGTNSKNSINKQLASYASFLIKGGDITILDLIDYEMPIYSIDRENENGIPQLAHDFLNEIKKAEAIVVSLAEHNGSYTVAFKNILDWISRIDKSVFQNKPMLLMATSPGARGGKTVFETAKQSFPRFRANIVAEFSLPNFYDNFKETEIIDEKLDKELIAQVTKLSNYNQ